jgi:predicted hotdog family 3-hydroxylacyl-ACP dehydratase
MSEFPPIVQLVPHREPMILLDELLDWKRGWARCRFEVRREARFVVDGRLETPFMMEHMAQAVAVCLGYEAFRDGRGVRVGMIVGCRSFDALVPEARVGDELIVTARQRGANQAVSGFECSVERNSDGRSVPLARAHLTLYHGDLINPNLRDGLLARA